MNSTQIQNTLAPLISFVAGLLAAKVPFFDLGTWTQIMGGVLGLAATLWAAFTTRNTGVITQAANLPEVKSVTIDAAAPNAAAVVNVTPDNVVKG